MVDFKNGDVSLLSGVVFCSKLLICNQNFGQKLEKYVFAFSWQ